MYILRSTARSNQYMMSGLLLRQGASLVSCCLPRPCQPGRLQHARVQQTTLRPVTCAAVVTDKEVPEGHKGLHGFLYGEKGADVHDNADRQYILREVGALRESAALHTSWMQDCLVVTSATHSLKSRSKNRACTYVVCVLSSTYSECCLARVLSGTEVQFTAVFYQPSWALMAVSSYCVFRTQSCSHDSSTWLSPLPAGRG